MKPRAPAAGCFKEQPKTAPRLVVQARDSRVFDSQKIRPLGGEESGKRNHGGVGRECGVGRGLVVALGIAVEVGVGVTVTIGVGVTVTVEEGVGVTVAVGLGVIGGVGVGKGVGVGVGLSQKIPISSTLQPSPEPLESLAMRQRRTIGIPVGRPSTTVWMKPPELPVHAWRPARGLPQQVLIVPL